MKDKILKLREEGKSYNEIVEILKCAKSTVSYHCGEGQKKKSNKRKLKNRKSSPLLTKLNTFKDKKIKNKTRDFQRIRKESGNGFSNDREFNFTEQEVLLKIQENPICYLTARVIDLDKPSTYHFDHITPVSKGGSNELYNLGLACKDANMAKHNLQLEDFVNLCKEVLENFNYKVIKL